MRLRRRWQRQPRLSGLRKLLHPAGEGQQPFEQQLQQRAPTTAATAATEALWLGREAAGRRQPSLQVRVKMGVSHAPKQFTLNGSLSKDFATCFGCTLHCRKFNWRLQKNNHVIGRSSPSIQPRSFLLLRSLPGSISEPGLLRGDGGLRRRRRRRRALLFLPLPRLLQSLRLL